jgi:hypothetical protein
MLLYVASKGALIGDVRTLAVALGPDGIAVSVVAPGLTDTPGSRTVNSDADFDAVVEHQALKRRLTPEDTASAVAYLASDGGAAMTSQVLSADGGSSFVSRDIGSARNVGFCRGHVSSGIRRQALERNHHEHSDRHPGMRRVRAGTNAEAALGSLGRRSGSPGADMTDVNPYCQP